MIVPDLGPEVLQYVGSSEKTEALAIAANSKSDGEGEGFPTVPLVIKEPF